ncbi:MAG TPA: hypothetical protein VFB73_06095 [Chloroflexota bacterium]|jgi:hypothetical protein|nr:hypothetical protein [Chloroflexota bacterium]
MTSAGEHREPEEHCRFCGEPLPPAAAAPLTEAARLECTLVTCPACAEVQVRSHGAPLCDGEHLALRHALAYLARRWSRAAEGPSRAEDA